MDSNEKDDPPPLDPRIKRRLEQIKSNYKKKLEKMESIYVKQDYTRKIQDNFMRKEDLSVKLDQFVQANWNVVPKKQDARSSILRKIFNGIDKEPVASSGLQQDIFSMMMLDKPWSLTWLMGIVVFSIQIILGVLLVLDQVNRSFFGTTMSIPIKAVTNVRVGQILVLALSVMSQEDILLGYKFILLVPYKDKSRWGKIIGEHENLTFRVWFSRLIVPNLLKMIQGALILFATFVLILQNDKLVNLLKDYSALFVVSSVDDLFFVVADKGFFGTILSRKADEVKEIKLEEDVRKLKKHLVTFMLLLMTGLWAAWIYILIGQENGKYVKQMYPLCEVDTPFRNTTYLSIIGDRVCQFERGQGTNIVECGWDGGDCDVLNGRYPECSVEDFILLGDGNCDVSSYNNIKCGFDNGDCVEWNGEIQDLYPACDVTNVGWIGDGICNGRDYMREECGLDGGDCDSCNVENIMLLGDGICNGGDYNTEECVFDGGDCVKENEKLKAVYVDCVVTNPWFVGDGICNGGAYNTKECGFDGGDCDECKVENIELVGDGFCNGKHYNLKECGFDGGDCASCFVQDMSLLGNGICDGDNYNVDGCGFDGGDCIEANNKLKEVYPNCTVKNPWFVGDKICNGGEYNTTECDFDGGDCDACQVANKSFVGDGICNGGDYYTSDCGFDGGDCDNCFVDDILLVGNGICNGGQYYVQECGFDGGDCANCTIDDPKLVGDEVCDKKYETEGCGFDGGDCNYALNLVGDVFNEPWKWYDFISHSDGMIYGLPADANKILKFDPAAKTTTLVGDDLGLEAQFYGGLIGPDNMIYGIPGKNTNKTGILRFDPSTEETTLLQQGNALFASDNFSGGVLARNGMIYILPLSHNKVVKFDPSTLELTEIGEDLSFNRNKYWGGALGPDGNIYGIPYWGDKVIKINVNDDTTSFIGDEYPGQTKWRNGILAKDGNIYASPAGADHVLQINVITQTTSLVGPNLFDQSIFREDLQVDGWKWVKLVEGSDGFIYGMPAVSNNILRFDPISHDARLIPLDASVTTFDRWKWTSGALANDGFIYAVPFHEATKQVLAIAPLQFRENI